jgi:phosphomethylpyrimidine synthase
MTTLSDRPSVALPAFSEAFPRSTKVYLEGDRGVRVPVREIALSGGELPLQVYDTSGPQGFDVRRGVPPLRRPWILSREVEEASHAAPGDGVRGLARRPAR